MQCFKQNICYVQQAQSSMFQKAILNLSGKRCKIKCSLHSLPSALNGQKEIQHKISVFLSQYQRPVNPGEHKQAAPMGSAQIKLKPFLAFFFSLQQRSALLQHPSSREHLFSAHCCPALWSKKKTLFFSPPLLVLLLPSRLLGQSALPSDAPVSDAGLGTLGHSVVTCRDQNCSPPRETD